MVTAPLSFDEMLHLQPPTWTTSMTDKTPKADALRRMREQAGEDRAVQARSHEG